VRRGIFGGVGLIVLAVIGFIVYLSIFVVDPTEQVLVLRFGNPVRVITTPGLNYKLPLVDNVVSLEKRILDLDSPPLEIIASDQKRLVVDAFGRYQIIQPLLFYQTVGSVQVADTRLSVILNSAVRRVLGDASFFDVVREKRAVLMTKITEQVNNEGKKIGVSVIDVKIRRADLPTANSQAIFQRMQTNYQRQATEIRAGGEQEARRIRAEADRTVTVLVADANGEAERLRGDGEAARNRIFAAAFGKDPDFFAFYRSMQAYQTGLRGNGTRLVISPDSDFFRYFNDAFGRSPSEPIAVGPLRPTTEAAPPAPESAATAPAAAAPVAPAGPAPANAAAAPPASATTPAQ